MLVLVVSVATAGIQAQPWPQLASGSCLQACLRSPSGHGSMCSTTCSRQDPQLLFQILATWYSDPVLYPLSAAYPNSMWLPKQKQSMVGLAPHVGPAGPNPKEEEEEEEWAELAGQCPACPPGQDLAHQA